MKHSFQNKLNQNFHLVHEEVVTRNAFLFCGKPYNVAAVFQVWERRPHDREPWPVETKHPDFEFLKDCDGAAIDSDRADSDGEDADSDSDGAEFDGEGADFAMRRVGGLAGKVLDHMKGSPNSNYFIRPRIVGFKEVMVEMEPEFRAVAANVAGNPSLAKSEIIRLYRRRLEARSRS